VNGDDSLDDLLDELESHDDLDKAGQTLTIRIEERRYGKAVTVIEGFDQSTSEIESVASELKSALAAGGTTTEQTIEIQGDHGDRAPKLLREQGYDVA